MTRPTIFLYNMPEIFRYFWFLCAAVMTVNIIIWRIRLAGAIERDMIAREEADRFTRLGALWLVGSSCAFGLIGLAAGWSSPFCAGFLSFDSVPQAVTAILMIALWSCSLWWVWRGKGAEFLARVGPMLNARQSSSALSPRMVRLGVTAVVLASAAGSAISWRVVPADPAMTCPKADARERSLP